MSGQNEADKGYANLWWGCHFFVELFGECLKLINNFEGEGFQNF